MPGTRNPYNEINGLPKLTRASAIKEAIRLAQERGVSYEGVMAMAVHLSPSPALKPIRPFDDNDPEPRWGKENAEHFAKLLHEFYRVTHAKKFFAAHRQMYQLAETRFAAKLTDFDLDWYQKFYGEMPKGRFNLILGNGITAAGTMVLT